MPSSFRIVKRAARREQHPPLFGDGNLWRFFASAFGITTCALVAIYVVWTLVAVLSSVLAFAADHGQFAGSPLKPWFDQLASGKGLCCSFADGLSVEDVDWDVKDGHYRVRLNGQWISVPDTALVTEPNRYGRAVVWPYADATGMTQIRCFMPGAQG